MRKVLGLVGATLLFAAPALAADLGKPVLKAPALMPVFSWTGCYIGADIGGAWDRQHASVTSVNVNQAPVSGDLTGNSAIGGPYAGCNFQFAPQWVLGVEGDFSWTKLSSSTTAPNLFADGTPVGSGGVAWANKTDWLASLRGRLGFAVVPNVLVYGTGGVAWTRTSYAALDAFSGGCPNCLATAFDETHTGWVAGAGIDWAPWNNNWILRLEYLHYQFSGASSTAAFNPAQSATFTWGDLKIDTVRAGVAFKF
jgi:outer membrane immunogenic protein